MTIPAPLARNMVALHRPISRNNILQSALKKMTVVGKAGGKGRAIIKRKCFLLWVERLFENLIFVPELENFFLNFWKLNLALNFLACIRGHSQKS